jgi:hypothetical protein
VVNFPADAALLYTALRAPQQLAFAEARVVHAPVVAGCTATVELTLSRAISGAHKVRLVGAVRRVYHKGAPRLINRAEGLLLESLVLASRVERQEASVTLTTLTENYRVVRKVAPGSDYERALATLLQELGQSS